MNWGDVAGPPCAAGSARTRSGPAGPSASAAPPAPAAARNRRRLTDDLRILPPDSRVERRPRNSIMRRSRPPAMASRSRGDPGEVRQADDGTPPATEPRVRPKSGSVKVRVRPSTWTRVSLQLARDVDTSSASPYTLPHRLGE